MRWADVELSVARTPIAVGDLTPGERAQLPDGPRRHDWLLGRAALKTLVGADDTSWVAFPNRCLSLSHSAGVAVAVRCRGPQAGLGVDLEGWRTVDPRAARFYLRPGEHRPGDQAPGDLLRLWTVKEALFKSTPDNDGAVLLDYEVADRHALGGGAWDRLGRTFRYLSRRRREGWLTIAVCDEAA